VQALAANTRELQQAVQQQQEEVQQALYRYGCAPYSHLCTLSVSQRTWVHSAAVGRRLPAKSAVSKDTDPLHFAFHQLHAVNASATGPSVRSHRACTLPAWPAVLLLQQPKPPAAAKGVQ
jgi:hypothetical protein